MPTRTEVFSHPAPTVNLRQINGSITIRPARDGQVEVLLTGREEAIAAATVEQHGGEIVVTIPKPRRRFGALIVSRDAAVDITVSIPANASLVVATVSGDIEADARCLDARLSSVSGDLKITGDWVSGVINTISGNLTFDGGFVDLHAKSVSGDMTITTRSGISLAVTSVSGDIDIHVWPGAEIDIEAKSLSGDLRSEIPLDQSTSSSAVGESLRIIGKTVSGDLHIHRSTTP